MTHMPRQERLILAHARQPGGTNENSSQWWKKPQLEPNSHHVASSNIRNLLPGSRTLQLQVFDEDSVKDDLIGSAAINLDQGFCL